MFPPSTLHQMKSSIPTFADTNFSGKTVFVRVDFNVPLDGTTITDDSRIAGAVPTIKHLIDQGAIIVLGSHLGRPKSQKNLKYSLRPVAADLAAKLNQPVTFLEDCIGETVEAAIAAGQPGQVFLLENLRFYAGEEANDPEFCSALARPCNAYVNDAFGTAHRAHASTAGIAALLPHRAAGFLIEKELAYLGEKTNNPDRPFVVILGGAKVSDKISVIDALLEKADMMLIGGAMAYTFALAQGRTIGKSLSEPDKVDTAKSALAKAEAKGVKLLLPVDNITTNSLDFGSKSVGTTQVAEGNIPDGWEGVDIGPKTVELFRDAVAGAKTVLWNGPMGIFEIDACAAGTKAVAEAVAKSEATSIIGGGDSVTAIKQLGYGDQVTFMSTGGGASLEFLEGKVLPGVAALAHD
jgi:phosphoglycerate kinase